VNYASAHSASEIFILLPHPQKSCSSRLQRPAFTFLSLQTIKTRPDPCIESREERNVAQQQHVKNSSFPDKAKGQELDEPHLLFRIKSITWKSAREEPKGTNTLNAQYPRWSIYVYNMLSMAATMPVNPIRAV
jgi:hypothetical protein